MAKKSTQLINPANADQIIPDALRQTILNVHGKIGERWLKHFPSLLKSLVKQWNFKIENRYVNLTFNFTASVILEDGNPAVLKCGVPDDEFKSEIRALQCYAGDGAVRLIAADAKKGWLLEERCVPGESLLSLALKDDAKATAIALNVMQKLWRPVNSQIKFPTLAGWLNGLNKLQKYSRVNSDGIPKKLIDFSLITSKELLASSGEQVLLHGDLQHFNILSSKRKYWLAIDPKGVIGEREYEVCAFLRNPSPYLLTTMKTKQIILRRLDQIVEQTGFERERILLWSIVQAVLAMWWCIADKVPGKDYFLNYAQILWDMKYGVKI